jgi:mannose-6-phosphate isomerase-like protein (cupin superfamily)
MSRGCRVLFNGYYVPAFRTQQLWVLEGAFEVAVGDARYDLQADDCLAMGLDAPTTFHNPRGFSARYVLAVAIQGPPRRPEVSATPVQP